LWLLLFLSQQDFLINIHTMKHVVKIMVLLVAISACWIGLLQTSIIPRSHTWLVSFWFKFITYTSWVFLFIIELYIYIKKKDLLIHVHACFAFCICRGLSCPIFSFIPASHLFRYITGMLWSIDGWSWLDEFSNLPSRSTAITTGISLLFY
jgi:hypothetical protein